MGIAIGITAWLFLTLLVLTFNYGAHKNDKYEDEVFERSCGNETHKTERGTNQESCKSIIRMEGR